MKKIYKLIDKLLEYGFDVEYYESKTNSHYINISKNTFKSQIRFSNHGWTSCDYNDPNYNVTKTTLQIGFHKLFHQIKFDYIKHNENV